jgi:hypothetical protein
VLAATEFELLNTNQPDFLFTSDSATVSLEMKVDAKTCVEQVMKYALLHLAVERVRNRQMQHSLIFLGKGAFPNLWKTSELYASPADLRLDLSSGAFMERTTVFLNTTPGRFRESVNSYSEILASLSIGYLTYDAFADVLKRERAACGTSVDSQVYRNLIEGMLRELHRRSLLIA